MSEWWRIAGYNSNPLEIRPKEPLYGLEKQEEETIDSIRSGEIVLVYGPFGSGKTSLVLKIKRKLSKEFKILYINGEQNPKPDIQKIIEKNKYNRFLFFKFPSKKKLVIILDEAQNLDQDVFKVLKAFYDSGVIHSIVLVQIPPEISNASSSFKNRISRKIKVDFPDEETIVKIVRSRLGEKLEVSEEIIRNIARAYNNNVRSVLIELNNILREHKDKIKNGVFYFNIGPLTSKKDKAKSKTRKYRLSDQQKNIVKSILLSRLSIKEISKATGIPYNSVSKQISRLRKKGIVIKVGEGKNTKYTVNPELREILIREIGE